MGEKEFIQRLEECNGYCLCPPLMFLFEKRRCAEALGARCDFYENEAHDRDVFDNPQESDRNFLLDYKEAGNKLEIAINEYYDTLNDHITEGKVILIAHDIDKCRTIGRIKYKATKELLEKSTTIITTHCAECEQQLDIVGDYRIT